MEPITYKLQHEGNRYWTDPILSDTEWLDILHHADSNKNEMQLNALLMFFYQPGHKSTCSAVGKAYSLKADSVRNLIKNFGRFVVKNSSKVFRIETTESEKDTFWCVPMLGKELKDHFEWELRPELVAALRTFLIEKLIAEYRGPVLKEGLDNSRSRESYKWRLLSSAKEKSIPEVLDVLSCQEMNILTWRTKDSIKAVKKTSPEQLENCFTKLLSVEGDFYQKFSAFVSAGREFLSKQDADRILREKEAALFLACINPAENAVYKWTLYQMAASYLGLEIDSKRPYDAFVKILNAIIPIENKDSELVEKMKEETKGYFWSDLLNAQDVLWQTQTFMKASRPKNWLQLFYDSRLRDPNSGFNGWFENSYAQNVESLIAFIKDDGSRMKPDSHLQYQLLKKSNNGISDIASGQFNESEYSKILQDWESIYDLLRSSIDEERVTPQAFKQLENILNPHLTRSHPQALRRVWCSLFPDLLSSITDSSVLNRVFQVIRTVDGRIPEPSKDWLVDNLALMEYFKENISFVKPRHRAILAWEIYTHRTSFENKETSMNTYIDLLVANMNLVLTGAPGTGKTFLAKQIACQMILGKTDFKNLTKEEKDFFGEHCKLVQFHPSYDYTDFVEGLRPVPMDVSQNGFQRENGVMKNLCEAALLNLQEAAKSAPEQREEQNARTRALSFINAVIDSGDEFKTKTGKSFFVESVDDKAFYVSAEEVSAETIRVPLKDLFVLLGQTHPDKVTDIREIIGRKRTQQYDSYLFSISERMRTSISMTEVPIGGGTNAHVEKVKRENFVLIIDEINRGELSKIFGELFFAIDPGYRGLEGRVQTQYQNLVKEDDVFYEGFFVPENVYIIGTMNDIDRGVESMDFAIRRRFAWREVKAGDRIEMLDEKIPEWSVAAKRCMDALNKALKEKEIGLTSAYDIGPAYFVKLERYGGDFEKLWEYHIKGILTEYLRGTRGIDIKIAALKTAFDNYKG